MGSISLIPSSGGVGDIPEGDSEDYGTLPDLGLHPLLSSYGEDLLLDNPANFATESDVDVFIISGPSSDASFREGQTDKQVLDIIRDLDPDPASPTLVILCVTLDINDDAIFQQTASISRKLISQIFKHFDLHGGFLPDLLGRPNFWTSVSQTKADRNERRPVFEFYCQHPRWHQKGRFDQPWGSTDGEKAPCSLYMTHSVATNTTFYLVAAPDDGIWFSFLDRIRHGHRQHNLSLVSPADLAASPFLLHAIIASIAFEQATFYAANIQFKLMDQLNIVNDYADNTFSTVGEFASRSLLQRITIRLHTVSQMINTGMGRVSSSVKLSDKILSSHSAFCAAMGRGEPGSADQRTRATLEYIADACRHQASWLEQYKARKETAMGFVFNMVTQLDSYTNLETSRRMAQDSSSMHTITIVTMVFLPGTFTATLFSSVAFSATDSGRMQVTDWLWPFIGVALSLTIGVVTLWYFRARVERWRLDVMKTMQRQKPELGPSSSAFA